MNTRFNEARNNESGFTLVELLVVIAIIAILTAIAVPAFLNQRQKANDASVRSDVKNVVTQVETTAVDAGGTVAITQTGKVAAVTVGSATAVNVNLSNGVTVAASGSTNDAAGYTITGYHSNGGKYKDTASALTYNSASGGFTN